MAVKKKNTVDESTDVSKSKAKREARRKQVEKEKRRKRVSGIVWTVVTAVVVLALVAVIGRQIYILSIRTTPGTDYSAGLAEDGRIENADMSTAVTLADYKNIAIPEDEVAATAEEVDEKINTALESYKELDTDPELVVADGDEVNIDYVGTVDGVEFDGGNSGGAGYDLTIGSGSFVDDFEQQLIGHKPGEEVTVDVTFPENYNEEMAGKDASFAVTIHGIQKTPELTDEFVAENLAETEEVSTAAEYRAKIEQEFRAEHVEEYVKNYVVENSTINTYPKRYVKAMKSLLKNGDQGMEIDDEIEYEKELTQRAQENVKEAMVYQAIFEDAGLTFDVEAHFASMAEESGEEYVDNMKKRYGAPYLAQSEMGQMAIEHLTGLYK